MKFTLSWLKDHLETEATLDEIAYALTDLGLEVEEVEDRAAKLRPFTLARVLHAEQHPDADKLRVCRVLTDEGEKQIVCGAPNARAGITVVLAKPGDYVPGIDVTLGVGRIRGVESHGMMASERELELSDEHDGIIELPSGEVGERFTDWLAKNRPGAVDPMIHIKVTPNRPDALGVRGLARDLAARGLGRLKPLDVTPVKGSFESPITVTLAEDVKEKACPHFVGRYIRGVKNGPSPQWVQDRLRAVGLRPISALVDITNLMTLEYGRPLHVFDAAKVTGNVQARLATPGETLLALDGKRTVRDIHRELGMLLWDKCGMARNEAGLKEALEKIPALREEFWQNAKVTGKPSELNQDLERAGRVADFLEFGELMVRDALNRNESCGGHFREESQTEEGEAKRDDENWSHVSAWEFKGVGQTPQLHKEDLKFEEVHLTQRSYK